MSISLVQSTEYLLVTATTRLADEIKAETDPARLITLLTLAFRAKIPRGVTPPAPPKPSRAQHLPNPAQPPAASPHPYAVAQSQSEANPILAAAGNGVRRFGERLADAPDTQPAPVAPTIPSTASTPASSSALTTQHSAPSDAHPPGAADDEEGPVPHYYFAMTDAEYNKLEAQLGFPDANRRRLIRLHLALDYANAKLNRRKSKRPASAAPDAHDNANHAGDITASDPSPTRDSSLVTHTSPIAQQTEAEPELNPSGQQDHTSPTPIGAIADSS